MGFLHKLWDETLAGPMPDTGLGKLRKYNSFPVRSSPPVNASSANSNGEMNVTRSITIIRTSSSNLRNLSVDPCSAPESPGSAPESPAPPSTPGTPLTHGTPRGDFRRVTSRKSSVEASESTEPTSLTDSEKCFGSLTEEVAILLEIYRQQ
uniref:Auxin-repressed 12.5 kDa protein-like isoform X1 n=1 Tax=Populus alba TaxID=43335 RepID=A0A4U5P7P0_POPAL|nr:auxin-repressed 12.5 kDa protein-like isoform X1 [Populus alba]